MMTMPFTGDDMTASILGLKYFQITKQNAML